VIAGIASVRRVLTLTTADGVARDVLYFVSGFPLGDGSPGGLVGTFIDVTRMRLAEREIARLSAPAERPPVEVEHAVEWSV